MKKLFLIIYILSFLFLSEGFFKNPCSASLLQDINTGINEYRSKDYESAKKSFSNYINSNPNDPDGYFWLAKTYDILKDKQRAKENFKRSYEILSKDRNIAKISFSDDSNIEDYFDMALAYFEAGNLKEADFYADLMLRVEAKSSSAYFVKAKIAQTQGNLEKATEYLNYALIYNNKLLDTNLAKSLNIVKLPPLQKEACNVLALEAYFRGDINLAIEYLKKYVRLDSNDIDSLNMLCDLYIKNNDLDSAQNIINTILKINPNSSLAYLNQAKIYELTKNKKLEEILLRGVKINPNNKDMLLKIANYYLKRADYENSKKYFETLTNIDDNLYEAYFGYIFSLIELGSIEEASECFKKKMIHLKQKNGEAELLLAKICIDALEYKEALEYLKEALKKEDNIYYRAEIERVKELSQLDKK